MKQHVQVHRLYFIISCAMVQQPADMILLPARARAGRECAGDESYGLGSSPRNLFLACSRLPLRSAHARLSRVDLGPIHWSLLPHGMAAPTPITADANKPTAHRPTQESKFGGCCEVVVCKLSIQGPSDPAGQNA